MSQSEYPRSKTNLDIELLRGVAALMVVVAHYIVFITKEISLLNFAFSGVNLFFVISGYVFSPYLINRELKIIPHAIRRFFRIYPLFVVALFLYIYLKISSGEEAKYIINHLLMIFTLHTKEEAFFYNAAFWSLPPEIEFYIALPLLAFLSKRVTGLIVLFVCSLLVRLFINAMLPVPSEANIWLGMSVHLPGMLCEFLVGAVANSVSPYFKQPTRKIIALLVGLGIIITWGLIVTTVLRTGGDIELNKWWVTRGNVGLISAFGFALILIGLSGAVKPGSLIARLAIVLGSLSYGVYLFHNAMPVLVSSYISVQGALLVVLASTGTILLAFVTYKLIENPCRKLGRHWAGLISK